MGALEKYSKAWRQPGNSKKTELVVYHRTIKVPQISVMLDGLKIKQSKSFKYLGFQLDGRLSFRNMLNAQMGKLRKSYTILKYIHRPFPAAYQLKQRFFDTYVWPHLSILATIYCLLSNTSQKQLNALYRRNLRLIYCVFQCATSDLHQSLQLPTLESRLKKVLLKRLNNIQRNEKETVELFLADKTVANALHRHYNEKAYLPWMPKGRPNKRLTRLSECLHPTFLDKLFSFALTD